METKEMGSIYIQSAISYVIALAIISTTMLSGGCRIRLEDQWALTFIGLYAGITLFRATGHLGKFDKYLMFGQYLTGPLAAIFVLMQVWDFRL